MTKHLMDAGSSGKGWSYRERQLTCPQYHAYEHDPELVDHIDVRRARLAEREPLIKGSLVHVGAAHHYLGVMFAQNSWEGADAYYGPAEAIQLAADRQEARLADTPWSGSWHKHVALAQETIASYAKATYNEHIKVIAVEHRVALPIEGASFLGTTVSTTHSARIDLIVQEGSRIWFWDHKTNYKVDERKKRGFGLAGQIVGHHMLGRHLYGDAFGGVRMNMMGLRKGGKRWQRLVPPPAPYALGELRQQIIDRQAIIDALKASGRSPWRYPKALGEQGPCEDRYGPCPYRELCSWGPRS